MLIWGTANFEPHRRWAILVIVVSLLFSSLFLVDFYRTGVWPSGGSLLGMTSGVIAGLIMIFEMFLWPRKTVMRTWRIGKTKYWLMAHLWLGLLCLPLGLLHGGFHFSLFRSPVAGLLSWLTVIVVFSGILGAILQQILPRKMLQTLPGETIVSQIPNVIAAFRSEAEIMVRETCGKSLPEQSRLMTGEFLIATSVMSTGTLSGRTLQTQVNLKQIRNSDPLFHFWEKQFDPFMQSGKMKKSGLGSSRESEILFQSLQDKLPPETDPVVNSLKSLAQYRRNFHDQIKLHFWLHSWLVVHVAISVALMISLGLHILLALQYP